MVRITGVMVQYYISCERELWFFANQINMNYDNEDILIGRLIHEKSYSREKKNVKFGDVSFDFIKDKNLTVFEIKKSSKLQEPVKYQLYYYLWYIKKFTGRKLSGIIVYPKEKKREKIELTPKIESKIEKILVKIKKIIKMEIPPPIKPRPYCKRCSYYEFCMV